MPAVRTFLRIAWTILAETIAHPTMPAVIVVHGDRVRCRRPRRAR